MDVRSYFLKQAAACERLGSPFTADLLQLAAERLDETDPVGRAALSWPGDPRADALGLRLAGALHALVLSGASPDLAAIYPGGARADDPAEARWRIVTRVFHGHAEFIVDFLQRPPQTNEVGRSAVLLGGFLTIAVETGLPLRLLEIGASAGLNLFWDAYAYDLSGASWGRAGAPLCLTPEWQGPLPPLAPIEIHGRSGCDREPLDPRDPGDRLGLRAYVWADQTDRRRRLEAALDLVAHADGRIERADAAAWAEARLAEPVRGVTTILFHSIVWQYLPAAAQRRLTAAIERSGSRAAPGAPLAWLRMEPAPDHGQAELRLTLFPGGQERLLAHADYHGRWVRWLTS